MPTWEIFMGTQLVMFVISGIICLVYMHGGKEEDKLDRRLEEMQERHRKERELEAKQN